MTLADIASETISRVILLATVLIFKYTFKMFIFTWIVQKDTILLLMLIHSNSYCCYRGHYSVNPSQYYVSFLKWKYLFMYFHLMQMKVKNECNVFSLPASRAQLMQCYQDVLLLEIKLVLWSHRVIICKSLSLRSEMCLIAYYVFIVDFSAHYLKFSVWCPTFQSNLHITFLFIPID